MPLYETDEDRANEREVAERFIKHTGGRVKLLPTTRHQTFDYWVVDQKGRGLAVAEVKCRDYSFSRFPSMTLHAHKWNALCEWTRNFMTLGKTPLPFLILTKWLDGFWYYKHDGSFVPVYEFGGRTTKTRRTDDLSAVVQIPKDLFKEF